MAGISSAHQNRSDNSMNPKKIRVQVTLTETLSTKLEKARELGYSYGALVESALVDYFAKVGIQA